MSKTPRTDEKEFAAIDLKPSARVVYASFCRQLENELADKDRQLAEARAEIDGLTLMATNASMEPARRLIQKNKELHAVIEQMREALKALRKYPNTYIATGQGGGIAENDLAMCDAALAAERGE